MRAQPVEFYDAGSVIQDSAARKAINSHTVTTAMHANTAEYLTPFHRLIHDIVRCVSFASPPESPDSTR